VQVIYTRGVTAETRATRRDATDNRKALLAAARVELNLDPDVSLETIAARAGLSRRTVYAHFRSGDELKRELVKLGVARVASALAGVGHSDPVVRLALIASRLWREVESVRLMAIFAIRGPLQASTMDDVALVRTNIGFAITHGVSSGKMRSDIPAPVLIALVERAMFSALSESAANKLDAAEGQRLVMLLTLGTVGFSAADAATLIDTHRELDWPAR
jgi:AcrR family transcriptional regulator